MKKTKFLPSEFEFIHSYCLYLHDYLVEFILYGEKHNSFRVSIEFTDENDTDSFAELEGEEILLWLEEKEYSAKLGELLLKSLFPALLSDYCQFVYEALSCSQRGRLSVAYSLLRKPLKENLAYFEWLLGEPEQLLNTLYNDTADSLAISILTQKENLLPVMESTLRRLANGDIYDLDTLYNLRYDKSNNSSFERLWNKAIHLITTHKHLKTEPKNLNFIFSDYESKLSQWYFLYSRLPILLLYTTDICDSLSILIDEEIIEKSKQRIIQKNFGFLAYSQSIKSLGDNEISDIDPADNNQQFKFHCPHCDSIIGEIHEFSKSLFLRGRSKCNSCKKRVILKDFVNDNA